MNRHLLANAAGACAAYGCDDDLAWRTPNGTGYCPNHGPRHLRPTPEAGCADMKRIKHYPRTLTIVLIGVIAAIGLIVFAPPSEAHVPPSRYCNIVWNAAPAGGKWAAKQRCVAAQRRHTCITHTRPVPGYVRVKGVKAYANQRKVIGWTVNEGLRRNLPYKVVLTALVAGTQESGLAELAYGDGTSLGPWQLISDHGPAHLRITVEFSGDWFYNKAMRIYRRNPGIGVAQFAQAVEASAHPGEYAQWIPESNRTLDAVLGPCRLTRR